MEAIDFNKLSMVVRHNWMWLVLIFLVVNAISLIYVRYTKNLFESSSELKLEVKNEASDLGIKNMVEDQNLNLMSGEIELIQSKLFLGRVLESSPFEVGYYSKGRVLNEELFKKSPFFLQYKMKQEGLYNVPVSYDEIDEDSFVLRLPDGKEVPGKFGQRISLGKADVVLTKNDNFTKGDEVGYFFVIHSKDVLQNYLRGNLTAEPLNYNANTIRVAFRDYNPYKAQAILNKIDTLYLQYSYEQKNLANRQKIEWLSNELSQIERKMEGFENYFENFTLQNKTVNLDDDLSKTIFQINKLDSQRYHLTNRISTLSLVSDALQNKNYLASFAHRQYLPEALNRNLEELHDLILDQEKLKMSYNEVTFAYRKGEKEIENLLQKSLAQLDELKSESAKRLLELNKQKLQLEREFANLPDKNTEFSKNLRFYKLNEQLYLTLMQSKSEFEVVQAGSTPDFQILSPASLPQTPMSPKKAMIVGAGFVASLVLIIFFIGLMYLLNNKITSLSELEYTLKVPVLGVVPSSRHIRENTLFVVDQPKSMVSEAIRTMRTNLDFFNIQAPKRVIAISSTVSGEGKSFVAMNLGGIIALSKKKVILVDLDMRKNKSNVHLPVEDNAKGVSTILIKRNTWQECVTHTAIELFDYLPAGPHPPNPSELLLNGEFTDLLDNLRKHYDYVLLDTPPVGLVTDGIMAMKHADLSIYIFRANYSRSDFLLNLQRIININKFSNLTMVLNALPSAGEHKYGYGYYTEAEGSSKWKQLFNT
jgi:tyrosine-protein kinase Etk/Wzc